jgi:hypothetical protein
MLTDSDVKVKGNFRDNAQYALNQWLNRASIRLGFPIDEKSDPIFIQQFLPALTALKEQFDEHVNNKAEEYRASLNPEESTKEWIRECIASYKSDLPSYMNLPEDELEILMIKKYKTVSVRDKKINYKRRWVVEFEDVLPVTVKGGTTKFVIPRKLVSLTFKFVKPVKKTKSSNVSDQNNEA